MFARSTSIILLVSALAATVAGCASHTEDDAADQAGADLSHAPQGSGLTDAQLAAELATPLPHPTTAAFKKLVADTVTPVATTARLKMLNDFLAAGIEKVDPTNPEVSYDDLAFQMEGIFWATPRDLTSSPAGNGGQTFSTSIVLDDSSIGPTKLTVSGTASAAYTLEMAIAGSKVEVSVPAGSDAKATAKLIGDAVDKANDAIMKTIEDEKSFGVIGGSHASSLSGVDDLEISTDGATVSLLVAMNG